VLAVVLAGAATSSVALAARSAGVIAFSKFDGINTDIYFVDPDGRNLTQFTWFGRDKPIDGAAGPTFARDGRRLAFVLSRGSARSWEIYVFQRGGLHRLTRNRTFDVQPAWSPAGQRIVFSRALGLGTARPQQSLFVMDDRGGHKQQLTVGPHVDEHPAWSPRGGLIAFDRYSPYADVPITAGIYVMRPDGSGQRLLAPGGSEPAWSPDGRRIAFVSTSDSFGQVCIPQCQPAGEIYVMNADGTGSSRLTTSTADDRMPTWSPGGHRIAWLHDVDAGPEWHPEVFAMRADGSCRHRITRTPPGVTAGRPSWTRSSRRSALPRCFR
jgi:TolB protein